VVTRKPSLPLERCQSGIVSLVLQRTYMVAVRSNYGIGATEIAYFTLNDGPADAKAWKKIALRNRSRVGHLQNDKDTMISNVICKEMSANMS